MAKLICILGGKKVPKRCSEKGSFLLSVQACTFLVQVNDYEIVVNFFHISHNLT